MPRDGLIACRVLEFKPFGVQRLAREWAEQWVDAAFFSIDRIAYQRMA